MQIEIIVVDVEDDELAKPAKGKLAQGKDIWSNVDGLLIAFMKLLAIYFAVCIVLLWTFFKACLEAK